MPYIESHTELADHPKLKKLMRLLRITRAEAVGHLHLLWWWSWFYSREGSLAGYGAEEIADAADWKGDAQEFVTALLSCGRDKGKGFLEHDALGDLYIHDWPEYAGKYIERCKANAERARTSRERKRIEREACGANVPDQPDRTITDQPERSASTDRGDSSCPAASVGVTRESGGGRTAKPSVSSRQSDSGGVSSPTPTKEPSEPRSAPPRASGSIVPVHGASEDKPLEEEQADWRALIDSIQQDFPVYAFGLPAVVLQSLHEWHPRLDSACILRAIGEAVRNGAVSKDGLPKWNYVEKVCANWIALGVTRVEDIAPLEQDRAYRRERDKQSKGRFSQDTGDGPDVVSTVVRHPKPERRTK